MSRISATFAALAKQNRKALIPFITAGDPEPALTVPLMHALTGAGADVIELGVPFSDPMADGPTIQRASERALKHGTSLKDVLDFVKAFRTKDVKTPVVLMGYANPIEAMGYEEFAQAACDAQVDGVLVVDYPPQEAARFADAAAQRNIDAIFLLSPTSTEARIRCPFTDLAVAPEAAAESARTGKPLPSLHSSKFAPVPEPTLKTGVTALTAAALELLGAKGAP